MPWYKHPKYIKAKKVFIESFSPWQLTYLHSHLPKIVFICGGNQEIHKNRQILESYFRSHLKKFLTFRAEDAWRVISKKAGAENALTHEEWLAGFSDVVIILVESFGTVAELGAFSMSSPLRKKLLPILDSKFETEASFINTGPVKWVNSDSKFQPCIHTNFSTILTAIPEIENRINKTFQDRSWPGERYGEYFYTNKVMLFFLLQILVVLGPVSIDEITDISMQLLKVKEKKPIEFILTIGVALEIFQLTKDGSDTDYFYCSDFIKLFSANNTKVLLHRIQLNRAKALSKLIQIPAYKSILDTVNVTAN